MKLEARERSLLEEHAERGARKIRSLRRRPIEVPRNSAEGMAGR